MRGLVTLSGACANSHGLKAVPPMILPDPDFHLISIFPRPRSFWGGRSGIVNSVVSIYNRIRNIQDSKMRSNRVQVDKNY